MTRLQQPEVAELKKKVLHFPTKRCSFSQGVAEKKELKTSQEKWKTDGPKKVDSSPNYRMGSH